MAFPIFKLLGELQNITDGCTTEAVKALVIVTDNTDILLFSSQKKYKLFLDIVRILVLVNHQILNLVSDFFQNLWIIFDKIICFRLDSRKIQEVVFFQDVLILL